MAMKNTLFRQWEMLRHIPRHPTKISTSQIRDKLAVAGYTITLRSIQRDLEELSVVLPLLSDQGKPKGWSWQPDASQMELPALGLQAALAFKLVEAHLQPLLPPTTLAYLAPWFKRASGVLSESDKVALAAWPHKIRVLSRGMPQKPAAIAPAIQDAVYEGLLLERRLAITYHAPWFEGTKDYVVNPLAMVVRDGQIYLVCTMWDYGDVRHLLLHRMHSATLMEEPATGLEGFDLDAHIARGEFSYPLEPGVLRLKAKFDGYAATSVMECPLSEDQSADKWEDGTVLLSATVPDTLDLRAWLLGLGEHVTVLEPPGLVKEVADTVAALAKRYLGE
jgi:predicted DNA-binding transcriptional regulator YafY